MEANSKEERLVLDAEKADELLRGIVPFGVASNKGDNAGPSIEFSEPDLTRVSRPFKMFDQKNARDLMVYNVPSRNGQVNYLRNTR